MTEDFTTPRPGAARHDDPGTAHDAAESIDATALELKCWEALLQYGDMTTEEIGDRLAIPLQSVTPRMAPLERRGRILKTTMRRPGRSGRGRIVWHAIPTEQTFLL